MKEYMKMSDVFDGQVVANHGDDFNGWSTVDTAIGLSIDESGDGGFEQKTADYVAHAINSHDELVEMNKELLSELKAMAKAYVNLMESGKDRIESLGGDCDEVAYMAAHDANLVHACSVIGKYDGGAA